MTPDQYLEIAIQLGSAWVVGSLIGLERSFHGRPAGFRTHALVCVASALLMQVTTHQFEWLADAPLDTIRTDPTRMAQGIMTGIGFLGAGVIFKEGLTVRGLTTAASIWITSALGILYGIGFYYPAVLTSLAVLGTLGIFRWIENMMPSQFYAHHHIRFEKDRSIEEADIRKLLKSMGFSVANINYMLTDDGKIFEYRMVLRTADQENLLRLSEKLRTMPEVYEFRIAPTGD